MGILIMSSMEMALIQKRNDIEHQLHQVMRQKMDLHKYAAAVTDGIISIMEMAKMPRSCFGLAFNYAKQGHNKILYDTWNRGMTIIGTNQGNPQEKEQFAGLFGQAVSDPNFANEVRRSIENGDSMNNPFVQQAFQAVSFAEAIKKQMAAEQAKAEKERIKTIEDDLDLQQKMLETQLQATQQELQSVAEGKKQDMQNDVAKFA